MITQSKNNKAFLQLASTITQNEGLRLKPYKCTAGKLTIGVGRNLDDVGINTEEANFMLYNDLVVAETELIRIIGQHTYDNLTTHQRIALVDMIFNLGATRFSKFKNMLACLKNSDFKGVAREMLDSKWAKQVGDRAKRDANSFEVVELSGNSG